MIDNDAPGGDFFGVPLLIIHTGADDSNNEMKSAPNVSLSIIHTRADDSINELKSSPDIS